MMNLTFLLSSNLLESLLDLILNFGCLSTRFNVIQYLLELLKLILIGFRDSAYLFQEC
jgi:hypothetical protein